jgi:hypothetical protein
MAMLVKPNGQQCGNRGLPHSPFGICDGNNHQFRDTSIAALAASKIFSRTVALVSGRPSNWLEVTASGSQNSPVAGLPYRWLPRLSAVPPVSPTAHWLVSRRLFLLLQKIFHRMPVSPSFDVRHVAVNVLGFSPSIDIRNLKAKLKRCVMALAQERIVCLPVPDNFFEKRAKGEYSIRLHRGEYFERQPFERYQRGHGDRLPCPARQPQPPGRIEDDRP